MKRKLHYNKDKTLADVVEDAFDRIDEGEGFEYTIGELQGGTLKVVFEPDSDCHSVAVIGPRNLNWTLVAEGES